MTFSNHTTRTTRTPRAPDALLVEILSWSRPHDSACEKQFGREFLDPIDGMQSDFFGNRMVTIGPKPARVLWSCHIDTVAAQGGPQALTYNRTTGILSLENGKPGMSLGADDGAGLWIMLKMIEAGRPGLYVFHRGEEQGCLGSRWIKENTPELLSNIDAAVAFDRAGSADIITHQMAGMTCSDAFAQSFADQLNAANPSFGFRPDDGGVYTDTNEYAGLVAECSNVAVGYQGNHGPRETLDVPHVHDLCAAMLAFEASRLVIVREPGDYGDDRWSGYGNISGPSSRKGHDGDDLRHMLDMVQQYPSVAARLLLGDGYDPKDLLWEALEEEDRALDDERYAAWELP